MAQVTYEALTPQVTVAAAGCPSFVAEQELRNAAIEFFKRSLCWRGMLDPIQVFAGIGEYPLDSPTMGARVIRIYGVSLTLPSTDPAVADSVVNLTPKTPQELSAISPNWRKPQIAGVFPSPIATRWYTQDSQGLLLIAGVPTVNGSMDVLGSLAPTLLSTGIDADMAEEHYAALVHGALARLMAMPDKTWSNPALVSYHAGEFEIAIDRAKESSAKGFQSAVPLHTKKYLR